MPSLREPGLPEDNGTTAPQREPCAYQSSRRPGRRRQAAPCMPPAPLHSTCIQRAPSWNPARSIAIWFTSASLAVFQNWHAFLLEPESLKLGDDSTIPQLRAGAAGRAVRACHYELPHEAPPPCFPTRTPPLKQSRRSSCITRIHDYSFIRQHTLRENTFRSFTYSDIIVFPQNKITSIYVKPFLNITNNYD